MMCPLLPPLSCLQMEIPWIGCGRDSSLVMFRIGMEINQIFKYLSQIQVNLTQALWIMELSVNQVKKEEGHQKFRFI